MGFLSKAFKKVKPKSIARKASGKMGKGLLGKVASKAVSKSKNQSGRARMPSSGGIFGSLRSLSKEKPQAMEAKRTPMPARGRGMSGSNQRKVAMYKDGGGVCAGASNNRRSRQGAEIVR
jgi:hypothetical protein